MGSMDILPGFNSGYDAACSNLFVRGLPSGVDEQALVDIFSKFGDIQSCRLVPTTRSEASQVGLINLASAAQAREAVNALNGAQTDRGVLEVIPGPGPPAVSALRQQTPCDNLYVRNLPSNWSEQDLRSLFSPFGSIQESRILHRGDDIRGAGALVRMNNVEAASRAIAALNGHLPRSHLGEPLTNHPLLVRYADSPEEKARKLARKEQMATRVHRSLDLPAIQREDVGFRHSSLPSAFQAFGHAATGVLDIGNSTPSSSSLFPDTLQTEASIDAILSSLGPATHHLGTDPAPLSGANSLGFNRFGSPPGGLLQPPPPPPPAAAAACASLYVKNLPPETDKLWLYERFAPHGAILSVKVLQEEATLRCRGVGFVNFAEHQGALSAIQNVNGMKVADKHLHVSLQTNRTRT